MLLVMKKMEPLTNEMLADCGRDEFETPLTLAISTLNQLIELSSKLIDKVEKLESNQNELIQDNGDRAENLQRLTEDIHNLQNPDE